MDGMDGLRRRAAEVEANARREKDRWDAERRHREHITAINSQARKHDEAARVSDRVSFSPKATVAALIVGLVLLGLSQLNGGSANRNRAPEAIAADTNVSIEPVETANADRAGETDAARIDEHRVSSSVARAPNQDATVDRLPAADELQGPTLKALDTGSAVMWDVSDSSGYVTVSAAQPVPGGSCRNVAYSFVSDRSKYVKSAVWCKTASADWSPRG